MLKIFLGWQDRQFALLTAATYVLVAAAMPFACTDKTAEATAIVVSWCLAMFLFVIINTIGWAVVTRKGA